MLKELRLGNLRCFDKYTVEFGQFNIMVGKNNSGKSTVVDALRLVENVCRYAAYRSRTLKDTDVPFPTTNLSHDYDEDSDTEIRAIFAEGLEIDIEIPPGGLPYANVYLEKKKVSDASALRKGLRNMLAVIPPVGAFEETETLHGPEYLRSIMVSHLTPRNFRNIWHAFPEGFDEFQALLTKTCPGYTISPPEFNKSDLTLTMFVSEQRYDREIFWTGHGFQVWLQLLTFLVKSGFKETLVLDEPDIYLHSDLQKKLVAICKERANQTIIATHAVDVIEEGEPEDVISVDKRSSSSRRLSSMDEVQTCITQLGSYQNLKLVHFIRGRSCLFVEGDDFRYLKAFARKLGRAQLAREDGFSLVPLDGFANWSRLMDADWLFKNALNETVKCYVILDRDYYTDESIGGIQSALTAKGVRIHVWKRKEIENYIINLPALYRAFESKWAERHPNEATPLSASGFGQRIMAKVDGLKDLVRSQVLARRISERPDRSVHESTVISEVLREFEDSWSEPAFRLSAIPGKEFFAVVNRWLNAKYKLSVSAGFALHVLRADEVDPEVAGTIDEFLEFVNS